MTIVEQVRLLLRSSGFMAKEFEALMLYDIDMLRLHDGGPRNLTNRQVLRRIAPRIGAGICGEVANELAEMFLGKELGSALKQSLNERLKNGLKAGELGKGQLMGKHACWGLGTSAVEESITGLFLFADAFYLINLGQAHRFVAIKQGTMVELLQAWYDSTMNRGFSLVDWLALNNTRVSRNVAQFIKDLGKMSAGDTSSSKELFQPLAGPFLRDRVFELGNVQLTFAAVQISGKEMGNNLVQHYLAKLGKLSS